MWVSAEIFVFEEHTLLSGNLLPGDILLTLGAGDVWKVGEEILEELKGSAF